MAWETHEYLFLQSTPFTCPSTGSDTSFPVLLSSCLIILQSAFDQKGFAAVQQFSIVYFIAYFKSM